MASCVIALDERFPQLLTQLENALEVDLSRQESPKNLTGITIFPLFEGKTPSGWLKIDGYNDHWLPEEFDILIIGPSEYTRLFCAIIDAWPGSVLQRTDWV